MRGPKERAVIRILQFLYDDGGYRSSTYISKVLRLSPVKVHEKLVDLMSLGLIERNHGGGVVAYCYTIDGSRVLYPDMVSSIVEGAPA